MSRPRPAPTPPAATKPATRPPSDTRPAAAPVPSPLNNAFGSPSASDKQEALADPAVKDAIDLFDGAVVNVERTIPAPNENDVESDESASPAS